MNKKKHIDELFKERFENHSPEPSPHIWEQIHYELHGKKKSRKVLPLWFKYGSVAAVLVLFLTVGYQLVYNTPLPNTPPALDLDKTTQKKENKTQLDLENSNSVTSTNTKESKDKSLEKDPINSSDTFTQNNNSNSANSSLSSTKTNTQKQENRSTEEPNEILKDDINLSSKNTQVTQESNSDTHNSTNKNSNTSEPKNVDSRVATITPQTNSSAVTTSTNTEEETTTATKPEKTRSLIDEVNKQNEEAQAIAETSKENSKNRWAVSPNIAPVYYSSLSNGSSIDPSFSDNSQNGDINLSYGVQVSYEVSNRLSIRSGISDVNLSYTTGDIDLGTGPVSVALKSIDYIGKESVIIPVDKGTFSSTPSNGTFGDIVPKSTSGTAEINQRISYFEVPLELKYALTTSKIGIHMIGGISTLFLGENEVIVTDGSFSNTLGEANNLNDLSFTTNIGLGFDYKISQKFKFNIEPMFKYQLNPYSDSSVDFKPYYLGVYSGLSFKF